MVEMLKKNKEIFIICILYGIISLVFFVLVIRGNIFPNSDSLEYIATAKHLQSSAFFSRDGINAEYLRTPGYPLFLVVIYLFRGNNTSVVIMQLILMTIKVYIFYRILFMLYTPRKLSIFGSLLLLCNIQSYAYSLSILTETLFSFLLLLSLFFLVKYVKEGKKTWTFLAFSLLLHYALFVRPVLVYFNMLVCLTLFIAFIIKKVQFKCFALFTLCFVLSFGGWSWRNYLHSGVFTFSTIQKNNMQMFYAPIITAKIKHIKDPYIGGYIEGATDYHNEMFLREYPDAQNGNLNEAQVAILRGKYGTKFIRSHLSEYIIANLTGFYQMFFKSFGTTALSNATTLTTKKTFVKIIQLLYLVYLIIIYVVYLIGLGIGFKKYDIIQISIFLLCGYLAVPGAIFGNPRFRDPFFPLLLLSAISNSRIIIQWLSQKLNIPVLQHIEKYLLHESNNNNGSL